MTAQDAGDREVTKIDATSRHRSAIVVIVLVTYFMIILDSQVVYTGLTHLRRDIGFSSTGLSWVQNAYTLTFGGLLLLAARAGDIVGRRRLFITGLVVFSVASLLVGIGQTESWIVGARALQGVGAAILGPSSLSLLTSTFPEGHERSRVVSWYAAIAGIGGSLGLVIGGTLTQLVSWRIGFLINIPVGVLMLVLAIRHLHQETPRTGRFDVSGAVLSTLGMTGLTYGIVSSADHGWTAPLTLVTITGGLVLLALFVVNESRARQPIMPLHLFASRIRSGTYGIRLLYLGAVSSFFFFTAQLLQEVFHWNSLQTGLGFFPMTVVNFLVSMAAPHLGRRFGAVLLLGTGIVVTLAGTFSLSLVRPGDSYALFVALPMILVGAGQGLAFAPMTSFGINGVDKSDSGAASGTLNTVHQLGRSLGLAALVALGANVVASSRVNVVARQYRLALEGSSVMLAAAIVIVLVVILPAWRRAASERIMPQPAE